MIADQPVVSRHSLAEEQRPAQQQGQVGFRVLARAFSRGTFWHFLALISKKSSSLALVFLTRGPGSPGQLSNGKQREMGLAQTQVTRLDIVRAHRAGGLPVERMVGPVTHV